MHRYTAEDAELTMGHFYDTTYQFIDPTRPYPTRVQLRCRLRAPMTIISQLGEYSDTIAYMHHIHILTEWPNKMQLLVSP